MGGGRTFVGDPSERTVKFRLTEEQARDLYEDAEQAAENDVDEFRFRFECPPEPVMEELEKRFPELNDE